MVGNAVILEAIEAAASGLVLVTPHKGLEAGVDHTWDNACHLKQTCKRGDINSVLVECLLEQASAGTDHFVTGVILAGYFDVAV